MPRKYERTSLRATSYTEKDMEEAIEKVRTGELTNYAASQTYGIPKSTLHDRVQQKTGAVSKTLGRPPALPLEVEVRLVDCLKTLEKWGFGLSRSEVIQVVSEFVKRNKIKTSFKNDTPGPDWFISFRKRHRLSIKKPQPVEYLRKRMTDPFVVNEYFELLKNTLNELNLNDPLKIWNLDETSVSLDPTKTKVVGGINLPCTRTTFGTGKENITVLTTVNAGGKGLNPLVVFKGKNVYEQWMAEQDKDDEFEIAYAASKRGWMESDIFFNYMKKVIIPGIGDQKPALIIYDGHSTHVDARVVELAAQNELTILKLPAHTSHLLQPLDIAVFKSFKTMWDSKLVQWQRQNVGTKMRKQAFAEMFAKVWKGTKPQIIKNGFRKAGIYPFNPNVIPKEKFDPNAYKRWTEHKKKTEELENKQTKNPKKLTDLCLSAINKRTHSTSSLASIKVLSNIEIDDPKQKESYAITFENLLLQKFKQDNNEKKNPVKLKRVAKGAEIITKTFLDNQKQEEEKKKNKKPEYCKKTQKLKVAENENDKPIQDNIKKMLVTETQTKCDEKIRMKGKGVGKKSSTTKRNVGDEYLDSDPMNRLCADTTNAKITESNNLKRKCNLKRKLSEADDNTLKIQATYKNAKNTKKLSRDDKTTAKSATNKETKNQTNITIGKITKPKKPRKCSMDSNSDTSVSGTISKHSDSDIEVCTFDNDEDSNNDDLPSISNESTKYKEENQMKASKNLTRRMRIKETEKVLVLRNENETDKAEKTDTTHKTNTLLKTDKISNLICETESHRSTPSPFPSEYLDFSEFDFYNIESQLIQENSDYAEPMDNIILQKTKRNIDETYKKNYKKEKLNEITGLFEPESDKENHEFSGSDQNEEDHNETKNAQITHTDLEQKDVTLKKQKYSNYAEPLYTLNDQVLVRYCNRNKCSYYVGIIENITNRDGKLLYTVNYYKTLKNPQLVFRMPRKIDRDDVEGMWIVKRIYMTVNPENPNEFLLTDVNDSIYF